MTGASGFVGGRFAKDFSSTYQIDLVSLREVKISDLNFSGITAVVHCAALVHQMQGAPDADYFRVNHDLTLELAQAAKKAGVQHFVFLSTAHVFGDSGTISDNGLRLSSSSECHPTDAYGRSKLAAEQNLFSMATNDFKVSVIRPPMVYGEGAKGNMVKLAQLVRRVPILPFGYWENRRSLIYVGNLSEFIHRVLVAKKTGIFLPQDEKALSIAEMIQLLSKAMERKVWLIPLPIFIVKIFNLLRPKMATRLFGTLALDEHSNQEAIGYLPRFSTLEGFRRMMVEKTKP